MRLVFIAIALVLGACNANSNASGDIGAACVDAGTSLPCERCAVSDTEELAVMAAALDAVLEADIGTDRSIAVRAITSYYEKDFSKTVDETTDADAATRDDFKNKNYGGKQYCIEGDLATRVKYRYVDEATYRQILKDITAIEHDGSRPDPVAVLSRVGFNADKTEAIAYAEYTCGSLCGDGALYLLRKSGNAWTVYKILGQWIS